MSRGFSGKLMNAPDSILADYVSAKMAWREDWRWEKVGKTHRHVAHEYGGRTWITSVPLKEAQDGR